MLVIINRLCRTRTKSDYTTCSTHLPYEIRLTERLAVAHEASALLVQLLAALGAFKAAGVPLQVGTDAQQPSIQNSSATAEAQTRTVVFHAEYCHYFGC